MPSPCFATVVDEQGKLAFVPAVFLAQPAHAQDFPRFGFGVPAFDDERDFAVVIVEANAGQPFVRNPLVELQLRK